MKAWTETIQKWIGITLISLLIVAAIGVTMRYKISYSLPFIDQKKFLHAHSHFAFAGWITQVLMALMIAYLARQSGVISKKYKWLLWANLITAYGMLLSFPFEGYGLYSIIFSTLSIFVTYVFAIVFWKDLNHLPKNTTHLWFKAGLLFNAISSIGAFTLAGLMVTKTVHQNWYLEAIYFFLHFQYNGWFFFACMGLLTDKFYRFGITSDNFRLIFWLFAVAFIPAYLLSVLWLKLPLPVYIIVIAAAFAQVIGWFLTVKLIYKNPLFIRSFSFAGRWLFLLSGLALTIKLLLQLGSTIPFLSHLAFGFRPIVIAYLHLVLLGVITLFIIGYLATDNYIPVNKRTNAGIFIFTSGIILNEIVLMVQGVADINYIYIPYLTETLLWVAVTILTGITLIISGRMKVIDPDDLGHVL